MAGIDKALISIGITEFLYLFISRLHASGPSPTIAEAMPLTGHHGSLYDLAGITVFAMILYAICKILSEKDH